MRVPIVTVALAASLLAGLTLGTFAARDVAVRASSAHDAQVIATVEVAAKRYSVCLSGDQNLIPDWAKEPRVPMFDLDEVYR